MDTKLTPDALQKVADTFRLFSEPSRLALLQELKTEGELSVNELVESTNISQAHVSKQLKMLAAAHFIERRKEGTKALYSIKDPMVFELCELVCGTLAKQESTIKIFT
jgi:ArsR family transcriptional regulator